MGKLIAAQLAQNLVDAMGVLRNKSDLQGSVGVTAAMLLIKRASDQPGFLRLPDQAHWSFVMGARRPADAFERALDELADVNPSVLGQISRWLGVPKGVTDGDIWSMAEQFDKISLRDDDLEFEDVVGQAFGRFIDRIGDSVGKRSYEFSTPMAIADLMARLARPRPGQVVYDPFVGTGGFLVAALEHVRENSSGVPGMILQGQEINSATCAIAKINLVLNNAKDSELLQGDSLAEPLHVTEGGRLQRFDRVLTHAPFSMNYEQRAISHPERMAYGWTSGHGKADLMIVQHVLSALAPDGVGVVLVPAGLLFRGGVEADIRRAIVEDGRVNAVISLGANAVPGLSIPACILVLRGSDGWRHPQRDICFINAEPEVASGRGGSRLSPEAAERIAGVFFDRADVPGFSRVASLDEIADYDYNLNVRRYVKGDVPSVPVLDSRAIIYGGIPRREVSLSSERFEKLGINIWNLLPERNPGYLDFPQGAYPITEERIAVLASDREHECMDALQSWWTSGGRDSDDKAQSPWLLRTRPRLLASFRESLVALGLLDKYQLSAVFAGWWSAWHDDLRALEKGGFRAVIGRWMSETQASRMTEEAAREHVLDRLGDDLIVRTQAAFAVERQKLVDIYRSWRQRYAVSLIRLEAEAENADTRLKDRLNELGYTEGQ